MATQKVGLEGIPLSLKCLLAAVAIVGGGYYAYKKRWIRLPKGLT